MLTCDQYLTPASLSEAFEFLAKFAASHRVVSGGTDILPWAREGRGGDVHYGALIDIGRLPELGGVRMDGARLWLGANTTFAHCLTDPLLLAEAPLLAHCASWFGDDATREAATLGGNLVNASPAADGTTALLALNAEVTLQRGGADGARERKVAVADFVTGPGATLLEAGELLTAIEIDALPGHGAAFEKVGYRRALVLSTVCVAAAVRLDGAGRFEDVRLALGAVGPVPVRLTECEQFLIGEPAEAEIIRQAAELPLHYVQSRTRQDYRRRVVRGFVERALAAALAGPAALAGNTATTQLNEATP